VIDEVITDAEGHVEEVVVVEEVVLDEAPEADATKTEVVEEEA